MQPYSQTTILIVDDNIGARRSIEGLLASEGYRLLLAESGDAALEIIERVAPDLILLDVMMPGMNGYQFCEIVRSKKNLLEIPIIMITALDDDESMLKGIDAGADDFLPKPINKLELRSRVRGITRLNRYRKLCGERQKFEWVVEHSSFGYVTIDNDAFITFINPRAQSLLHISQDENALGMHFLSLIERHYKQTPSNDPNIWQRAFDRGESQPLILVHAQTQDQPAVWLKATILDLEGGDEEQKLIRLEDITQEMLSFQEKHTFSRMISHKLLTPLHAIKASTQLLEANNGTSPEPEMLDRIMTLQQKGINRLEYDISSVIRYLDSSASDLNESQSKLNTLYHKLMQIGNESGIAFSLEKDIGDKESWYANISEYRFEACIREVIENAIKFHPHGTPSVDSYIQISTTENLIIFRFENDGNKLTELELDNVWQPFWQADRHFTGEIKGMGMGLALIATNVWAAGGKCAIHNRIDRDGISLSLSFPIFENKELSTD